MKARLLVGWALTLLGAPTPAGAAAKPADPAPAITRPFLWKIEGEAGKPSWLFGTIHLPRPNLTALNPAIHAALRGADAVYTEIPNDPATLMGIAPRMMLPAGSTLADVLPADLLEAVRVELGAVAPGAPFETFQAFKPWAMALSLVMLGDQLAHPGQFAMDTIIYQRAVMAGREVGGLETADEQLDLFEGLQAKDQITLVRDTVDQLRVAREAYQSPADQLTSLYLAGDLPALTAEVEKWNGRGSDPALTERFMERLLYGRNERMAKTIAEKLRAQPDRTFFFAVGAAHLDGPRGLLALLERAGFTLTRAE